MLRLLRPLFSVLCLLLMVRGSNAAPPPCDARTLAARIDRRIEARLENEGVPLAPLADDAEFFRRLSLDLNGRIPSVTQLTDFLDDNRPDKRGLWTDELLDGRDNAPFYVSHMTNIWRRQLLAHLPAQPLAVIGPLEAWLRKQLKADAPYDRIVRGLLSDPEAAGFLKANENKPENLAAAASRLFLGVKLECAQCHDDRSGGNWKRAQFWEFAAFFTTPHDKTGRPRLKIGDSDRWAEARFLDGTYPDWSGGATPRVPLANWITRPDNPWFARAAVNRIWRDLLGLGLIDPVDGLGAEGNPASHPELLDELAEQFAAHDFDTKYLLRAITGSRAYQRTSGQPNAKRDDPRLFARAQVRSLSGEQLRDSMLALTGYRSKDDVPAGSVVSRDSLQTEFVALFEESPKGPMESLASIQQALEMMNGKFIEEVTNPDKSPALAAVIGNKPSRPATRRIADLYLITLSRRPRQEELDRFVRHIEESDPQQALRDILWALLNSTEFVVNH